MALFDGWNKSSSDYSNEAIDEINNYYGQAQGYMSPYTNPAQKDINSARGYLYNEARQMNAAGNPDSNFFQLLQFTPNSLLSQAESGYKIDPATQNRMKIANSAVTNQLVSQGLYGSGQGALESAEVDSMIYSQGLQQYLKNLSNVFGQQLQVLGIDNDQRKAMQSQFDKLIGLEQDSSEKMADIAQRSGQEAANVYNNQARIQERRHPIDQMASLAGMTYGLFK